MRRGNAILEAWELRRLEEREQVELVQSCLWCDWEMAGPLGVVRQAFAEHREKTHADRPLPKRTKRHRPFRQFNSGTNIDDNIASARRQGAATWVGSE